MKEFAANTNNLPSMQGTHGVVALPNGREAAGSGNDGATAAERRLGEETDNLVTVACQCLVDLLRIPLRITLW